MKPQFMQCPECLRATAVGSVPDDDIAHDVLTADGAVSLIDDDHCSECGAQAERKAVIIFGSAGQVGRILGAHLRCVTGFDASTRMPVGAELAQVLRGAAAVIWSATFPPPHDELAVRARELQALLELLAACERYGVPRFVFTSSSGVGYHGYRANYYGAGKEAAEKFVEAWAIKTGATAVCLRLGNVKREPENRDGGMTDPQIMRCYAAALLAPSGYHLWNADPWAGVLP